MKRINALINQLNAKSLEALLVTNVQNVNYLSGFTGEAAHLIVSPKGCFFFTDPRYTEQAAKECHSDIQVLNWIENKRSGFESYQHAANALGFKNLGFESSSVSHNAFSKMSAGLTGLELVPTDGMIEALRSVKDSEEIKNLRTAAEISDRALELTLPFIKEGISEMALTAQLEYFLKTNGAEGLSFDSIILSGKKTSLLHGQPGSKVLEKGDFVLFDFGAMFKGYHADISRTFVIGTPSERHKHLYDMIQTAEMEAIKTLKAGISGATPDAKVREIITSEYLPFYYPGLGHGTGLQVHEAPSLSQSSLDTLVEGNVLTIEPGIYIPEWGGLRIEDSILVTADGYDILNQFPRDLMCL